MRQVPTKPFSATGQSYVMSFGKTNTFIAIQPHYDAQTTPKLDLQDPGGWQGLLSILATCVQMWHSALDGGRDKKNNGEGCKVHSTGTGKTRVG